MSKPSHSNMLGLMLLNMERDAKYYEALGRFVTAYARAETQVHMLARHYSTASDAHARILFHRLGLTKVMDLTRELMATVDFSKGLLALTITHRSHSEIDEVDRCLSQLAIISNRRGDLVHRSALTSDEGFEITNIFTAKQLAKYERSIIKASELTQMTSDCFQITLRLGRYHSPPNEGGDDPLIPGPPAWQYKLPPKAPPKAKPMKARKARKLQRVALREKQKG